MTDEILPASSPSSGRRRGAHRAPRRRRWLKRLIIALVVVALATVSLGVATVLYANHVVDKVHLTKPIKHLTKPPPPGQPFDVLVVGSDTRSFVKTTQQAGQFGSSSSQTGQRSDVTMVVRVVPATRKILVLSIPRDTYVTIPGNVPYVSGPNRINVAYNSGPDLLVQTIETDFKIPISDFAAVNFQGFANMVNSLSGVYLNFPVYAYDPESGLTVTKLGCQQVQGNQALALVRSRHYYYSSTPMPAADYTPSAASAWPNYDGLSDFSRIQRQDAFFRAVVSRSAHQVTNPLSLNDFLNAVAENITVNPAFKPQLLGLGREFLGVGNQNLKTETLPTIGVTLPNNEDVLEAAQPYADQMIQQFLSFGSTPAPAVSTSANPSTGGGSSVKASQVSVHVLNGAGIPGIAGRTQTELEHAGFTVSGIGNATGTARRASEIQYGPSGLAAARLLESSLEGGASLVSDGALTGDDVILTVGTSLQGVTTPSAAPPPSTTTTTTPPPPPDVYVNSKPEPFNPLACEG